MSKEDQRKRSRRTRDFNPDNSPWHVSRAIWSGDPEISGFSKPITDDNPKGFAPIPHFLLRAS
ncbi:hypothetical protein EVC45_13205 [Paraburkholderia sp. UYCP14C]|uniref:hypothetical protein n=1 Tax=Paraburkholderia sp. UYCP14C TaxID=2511130 RepID=UPI0010220E8B|nr:hypothetical protein [Paraburkholderia sp. UYCP14C]RZF29401.1 hypothetical protein EVC45_13205 [Paraburkholderia sp. UYCP14C]